MLEHTAAKKTDIFLRNVYSSKRTTNAYLLHRMCKQQLFANKFTTPAYKVILCQCSQLRAHCRLKNCASKGHFLKASQGYRTLCGIFKLLVFFTQELSKKKRYSASHFYLIYYLNNKLTIKFLLDGQIGQSTNNFSASPVFPRMIFKY